MASTSSPCAACKFLRRKCTHECVFAPYFPPDQPYRFACVHRVYGASNVAKLLNELRPSEREDAVRSLAYEAEARLKDPIYGCVGFISILQHRLRQVETDLTSAKQELATYMGPASSMVPVMNPGGYMQQFPPMVGGQVNMQPQPQPQSPILGLQVAGNVQHHQQIYEAQQQLLVEAAREQELLRNFELQQQQQLQHQQQSLDLLRFNRGFDIAGPSGQVSTIGFNHLRDPGAAMSPSLALGGLSDSNVYQHQHQEQHHQLQLPQHQPQPPQPQPQPQQQQPQHLGDASEEVRSVGLSC